MHTRRAVGGDEPTLRDLRIQALTDAPDAFGSTLERELARTAEDWHRWLSPGATFILEIAGQPRGLVAARRDDDVPGIVHLMAMWVHPDARGSGGADALVDEVAAWARADGADVIQLHVIDSNRRAQRCYERNGFRSTGRTHVRERDQGIELEMERQP
jgi:ribosomal protein S18 acetylase RimI-like enzyme